MSGQKIIRGLKEALEHAKIAQSSPGQYTGLIERIDQVLAQIARHGFLSIDTRPVLHKARAALTSQAQELERRAPTSGEYGWVYYNPDNGMEYSPNHPIESGESVDAEDVRRATAMEETLNEAFQREWRRAQSLQSDIDRLKKELEEQARVSSDAHARKNLEIASLKARCAELEKALERAAQIVEADIEWARKYDGDIAETMAEQARQIRALTHHSKGEDDA